MYQAKIFDFVAVHGDANEKSAVSRLFSWRKAAQDSKAGPSEGEGGGVAQKISRFLCVTESHPLRQSRFADLYGRQMCFGGKMENVGFEHERGRENDRFPVTEKNLKPFGF